MVRNMPLLSLQPSARSGCRGRTLARGGERYWNIVDQAGSPDAGGHQQAAVGGVGAGVLPGVVVDEREIVDAELGFGVEHPLSSSERRRGPLGRGDSSGLQ